MGKHREKKPAFGKKSRTSRVPMVASLLAAAALVAALQWLLSSSAATDAGSQRRRASSSPASPSSPRERRAASEVSAQRRGADAYSGHEWRNLSRSLPHCLSSQAELMSIPVPWPGFHALCIESFGDGEVSVLLHARSARHGDAGGTPSETSAGERRICRVVDASAPYRQASLLSRRGRRSRGCCGRVCRAAAVICSSCWSRRCRRSSPRASFVRSLAAAMWSGAGGLPHAGVSWR